MNDMTRLINQALVARFEIGCVRRAGACCSVWRVRSSPDADGDAVFDPGAAKAAEDLTEKPFASGGKIELGARGRKLYGPCGRGGDAIRVTLGGNVGRRK